MRDARKAALEEAVRKLEREAHYETDPDRREIVYDCRDVIRQLAEGEGVTFDYPIADIRQVQPNHFHCLIDYGTHKVKSPCERCDWGHDKPQEARKEALEEKAPMSELSPGYQALIEDQKKEIERLQALVDEAHDLLYNYATGKDDGSAIVAHVNAKLAEA